MMKSCDVGGSSGVNDPTDKPGRVRAPDTMPSPCVWIGNVCPKLSEDDIMNEFRKFGEIRLLRLFPKSRCAFVTYETAEQALASQALQDVLLGSMCLTLNVGRISRHLWVGNIGPTVNEDLLRESFSKCGDVDSIRILRHNKCAFVNMIDEQSALLATQKLNGQLIGNTEITINFQWQEQHRSSLASSRGSPVRQTGDARTMHRGDRQPVSIEQKSFHITTAHHHHAGMLYAKPSRQLFVGNIDPVVTQTTLFSLFQQFGSVQRIKRFYDRCYAFVMFTNLSDAIWARDQLSMFPPVILGRTLNVNFGKNSATNKLTSASLMMLSSSDDLQSNALSYFYYPPQQEMIRAHDEQDRSERTPEM